VGKLLREWGADGIQPRIIALGGELDLEMMNERI
jgi:hypothetical protein